MAAKLRELLQDRVHQSLKNSNPSNYWSVSGSQRGEIIIAVRKDSQLRVGRLSAKCKLLGHRVDYTRIARKSCTPCVRCLVAILDQGPTGSRVAHTLSCFFGWHHYVPCGQRAQHNEYVCERCGHPLLFESGSDPYCSHKKFKKKVNYLCGLLGHRVHVVKRGSKATEYACRCGHPFLKSQADLKVIRHPLRCVVLGHYVAANDTRGLWAEYVCLWCGHPFCFKLTAHELEPDLESNLEQSLHV